MGKREQEEGTLILPAAAVVPLRKALVNALNAERAKVLAAAVEVFDYFQQPEPPPAPGVPGKRTRLSEFKRVTKEPGVKSYYAAHEKIHQVIDKLDGSLDHRRWGAPEPRWDYQTREEIADLLVPYGQQTVKLKAPKKKDYPPIPANTLSFSVSAASLVIRPDERKVVWDVDNSKNAVEDAWGSALGKAFAKALQEIKWTRGTGGVFRYTDEYEEDACMSHGGNPISISQHFGPLGEQEFAHERGFHPITLKATRR